MLKKMMASFFVLALLLGLVSMTASAQGEAGSVVSAGGSSTFVIKDDGSLWGAGANSRGEVGVGHKETVALFSRVLDNVAAVSAAEYHTVALKRDGTLWGFGDGSGGRLPDGVDSMTPVLILKDVKLAAAGTYYTAAVKTDGTL